MSATDGRGILGTGSYMPERIVTNSNLPALPPVDENRILRKTAVRQRWVAAPDDATSDLATAAVRRAAFGGGMTWAESLMRWTQSSAPAGGGAP